MSAVVRLVGVWLLVLVGLSACGGGGGDKTSLESIAVTPGNPSAIAGTTLQLAAMGHYSDGSTQDLTTSVSWSSDAHGVATINDAGLATAVAPGAARITATRRGVSGFTDVTMTPPMISGSAAAGAPLAGTVTVKDSTGTTRSSAIGANGSFSIDAWGLVPPLLLRAEGNVGSTHYVLHSAATTIGTGGTVNITPLTELIIDNVAGQIAAAYFDNGNFAGMTQAVLDQESAALKARLLPVLQAMGVQASVDLLRTPFTPLASALDAALDVLRVSVDLTTNVATITNVVNQQTIMDDIDTPATAESSPPPLSATGTEEAADDLTAIRKVLDDLMALFKDDTPAWQDILPLLSDTFLHDDQNGEDFADDFNERDELVGGSVSDIQFTRIEYAYNGGTTPLAMISFNFNDMAGHFLERVGRMTLVRGSDGKWLLNGNRNLLKISMHVHQVNSMITGCRASGLEFSIQDPDPGNSTTIAAVLVAGLGLPPFPGSSTPGIGAIWIDRDVPSGTWHLRRPQDKNPGWYPMTGGCNHAWADWGISDQVIAAIPDMNPYFFYAYNFSTVEVPLSAFTGIQYGGRALFLRKRPLTLAEINASTKFPTFTTSPELATYGGGNLSVSVTNANPLIGTWVYLGLTANNLTNTVDATVMPAANGTFSRSLSLTSPGGTIMRREVRVATTDEYDRTFMSLAEYYTPPP